jgi:hypothetical protein
MLKIEPCLYENSKLKPLDSSIIYLNTSKEVKEYIKNCYPFSNNDSLLEQNLEKEDLKEFSFQVDYKNQNIVCFVTVKNLFNCLNEKENKKAWNGVGNIAEIFPFVEAYIVENAFFKWIEEVKEKEENVDSYRIGLVNDEDSMLEFGKLYSCCGSREDIFVFNEKEYVFGCNFGH